MNAWSHSMQVRSWMVVALLQAGGLKGRGLSSGHGILMRKADNKFRIGQLVAIPYPSSGANGEALAEPAPSASRRPDRLPRQPS
jgi:hypothetical protein